MPDQHEDFYETFDERMPLDSFHGSEHDWQLYLALWAALALVAAVVTWLVVRRASPGRSFSLPLFAALLTFLPSARDFGLVIASLGLFAGWALATRFLSPADRLVPAASRAWERVVSLPEVRFGLALFGLALVLDLVIGWAVFRFVPVIQDSQAQVFHAEILASGRFVAETPPLGRFFLAENMIQKDGAWYSIYPPGHIAAIALFTLVGAPFLTNPILGAATCVLVWGAARVPFGERIARAAGLFAALSPFVAYMSAEYMNHTTAAFGFALELFAIVRFTAVPEPPSLRRALALGALTGLGAGLIFSTKMLTCAALNLPVALYLAHRALFAREHRVWPASAALAAAAALVVALTLEWNRRTTGDPMLFAYAVGFPNLHYGFVDSPWGVHTPFRALEYTLRNANALDLYLLPLPLPGFALAIWGLAKHRASPAAWLFAGALFSSLVVYAGWYFQDLTFGPRYMFEASVGVYPLAVAALPAMSTLVGRTETGAARGIVLAVAIGLVSVLPGLGFYYRTVYGQDGGVVALARETVDGRAIVFVEGKYQRAFWAVHPELDDDILFARDFGERNVDLACRHPDRRAFVEIGGQLEPLDTSRCETGAAPAPVLSPPP